MENSNIAITINRQLGSGGKYLGRKLAERLKFLYVDHEIVTEAAKDLHTFVEELELRDEKLGSIWRAMTFASSFGNFDYISSIDIITDNEIHQAESKFITKIANHQSVVIIGRGGSYVLRQHPRHVSIFLHADLEFCKQNMQKANNITAKEALKLIQTTDKSRKKYFKALTGQEMFDLRGYDLSLDTSKLGFEKAENIIIEYIKVRFGDEVIK